MTSTHSRRILIPPTLKSLRRESISPDRQVHSFSGDTMGTRWLVKVSLTSETKSDGLKDLIIKSLNTVIQQMSPWEPESDLSFFRNATPGTWVTFAPESFSVLSRSLEIAQLTQGIYDPTIAQAVDLLGFGPSEIEVLSTESIPVRAALDKCDYRQLQLNSTTQQVLQPGNFAIDLCSIAKGYTVDLIAATFKQSNITDYYIEIGGEARGSGCKPNGEPWWCSIAQPPGSQTQLPETLCAACDISIATSGNYVLYHNINGKIIGHLLVPHSLTQQNEVELLSVSTFCDNCMDADAFASALFLMGIQRGLAFANQHDIAAIFRCKKDQAFIELESEMLKELQ
ncbi:FAD:protein FMN transferase [Puniceicoccaceae bacterium K14]|nr:FAD:protein FMN transferase [Puniceicoccaceae bacterium K14]